MIAATLRSTAVAIGLLFAAEARAATLYVWPDSPAPSPPYATWSTAAHLIQQAVDAAAGADEIVVTNGVYATGGRVVYGAMTNRVAVTKPVLVRSVNGPEATVIQGWREPVTTNGASAIRCAYLANGAVLSGFTLTSGATRATGDGAREQSGGRGSYSGKPKNCTLTANSTRANGGGAAVGALYNCALAGNSANSYGGAYEFQTPASLLSYAWLQQYGLPTDGSADLIDSDHDLLDNWQEWRCQTDPTNALSALRLLPPAPDGPDVILRWQSVPGVSYVLERSTNLSASPAFQPLATNLPGQTNTTSFRRANAALLSPVYYRVGVP